MDILTKEQVIFCHGLATKHGILRLISEKAAELSLASCCQQLVESFMEREALGPTGIGEGLAIPHAKSDTVKEVCVIIAKSAQSVAWESFDGAPVTLAIALLVPKENPDNIHLKVLSALTRKLVNPAFKQQLLAAGTTEEFVRLFQEFSVTL